MDFLSSLNAFIKTVSAPFSPPAVAVIRSLYELTDRLGFASYGIAIILFAILVRIFLFPFHKIQNTAFSSLGKIFSLHKERLEIQKKYFFSEELALREIEKLHKENGITPLKDCACGFIPLLIQMPVCIGIFSALKYYQYPETPTFLCMNDLSKPDTSGFIITLIVLRFVCSRFLVWVHEHKRGSLLSWGIDADTVFTAIVSSFILPSGLLLYMLTSSYVLFGENEWLRWSAKKKN